MGGMLRRTVAYSLCLCARHLPPLFLLSSACLLSILPIPHSYRFKPMFLYPCTKLAYGDRRSGFVSECRNLISSLILIAVHRCPSAGLHFRTPTTAGQGGRRTLGRSRRPRDRLTYQNSNGGHEGGTGQAARQTHTYTHAQGEDSGTETREY